MMTERWQIMGKDSLGKEEIHLNGQRERDHNNTKHMKQEWWNEQYI